MSTVIKIQKIDFSSLLTYCPRGNSPTIQLAHDAMLYLKSDRFVQNPLDSKRPIVMSEWIAQTIRQSTANVPMIAAFLTSNSVLVPAPSSSLLQANALWVPERLCQALRRHGFGKEVVPCLIRKNAVPKSAYSIASQRSTVTTHYNSIEVQTSLNEPEKIVVVDDVITRGATLLACANRLRMIFPTAQITAFAAMRTISDPSSFKQLFDPCIGDITYRIDYDDTLRRP